MKTITRMKTKIRFPLFLCLIVILASGCSRVETVEFVDLERYTGLWYQISAYETSFNEDLVGVTAQYTLLDDGTIEVYNRGYLGDLSGPLDEITGTAVVVDEDSQAQLRVSFPSVPINLPFSNYWIIVLGEDDSDSPYPYAAVTDPFGYTLFILSRTPTLDEASYNDILQQVADLGLDVDRLILTPQF